MAQRSRGPLVPPSPKEQQYFRKQFQKLSPAEQQLLRGAMDVINQHGAERLIELVDDAHEFLHSLRPRRRVTTH
jgi:hypothetical protein